MPSNLEADILFYSLKNKINEIKYSSSKLDKLEINSNL